MNADAAATPAFICLFPLLLMMGIGVVVVVILFALRMSGGRRDLFEVSSPLKRILAFGIPIVLFALGISCTAFLIDNGPSPIAVSIPALIGMFLAAGTTLGLSRWAYPEWWASRQRLTAPDRPVRQPHRDPALRPGEIPYSVRRLIALGVAGAVAAVGLLIVVNSVRSDMPFPFVVILALVFGAVALSVFAALSGWAYPHWWKRRIGHPSPADSNLVQQSGKVFLKLIGISLCGIGLLATLYSARQGERGDEWDLVALFPLVAGGLILWAVVPKVKAIDAPPMSFFGVLFSKTGAGIFLWGLLIAVVVAVVTDKHSLAKLAGSGFIIGMVWWRWRQLRTADAAVEVGRGPAVDATHTTADPVSVAGITASRKPFALVLIPAIVVGLVVLVALIRGGGSGGPNTNSEKYGVVVLLMGVMVGVGVLAWRLVQVYRNRPLSQPPVAPLLLTPDPTAVRGDCPTCYSPIPADSPHGLCPRCLIRGAMPSPTRTRLRGVGPIEPPSPAEVGEFFPHLEVLELIGAGGMGAVYKVRQPTLDRVVALKIVQSPRGDEDPVFAERFAREARAMAKLDHPNIVTIHESGEAGGLPFLLMEYVDGITLREAMVNGVLTAVEALAVIPQVCDALEFAHRHGVVHRDIKPENILLDQTGRVKIADFGLAKLADPKNVTLTRTQQAMGTPHYMAPEQWERPNDVDHRADVYALGVVLYELLTGELPLGRFALPSEKGKGDVRLDQVVIRALAKDPGERYQNAGQMKAALSGVKLTAFAPGVIPKKRRGFEFKSKANFLGLPLVHVVAGWDPTTGRKRVARGWIAVGDVMAVGGIAVGGVTGVGVIGVGGVAGCGLLAVGGALALGVLAAGGNAAGVFFAVGGNSASMGLSVGGLAAGKFAIGGEAAGEYVITDKSQTPGFWDALWAWKRSFWPFS